MAIIHNVSISSGLGRRFGLLVLVVLSILPMSPTLAQEIGADGIGDSLYPQLGNGGYDVQHYHIDLHVTPENNYINATAFIDAMPKEDLLSFNLDLHGLTVGAVTVDDEPALFERTDDELNITPSSPLSIGTFFSVKIEYSGVPQPILDPAVSFVKLGWQEWNAGYFAAVGQPSGSMNWFPCNNHPLDKATFSVTITVPQPLTAVANGVLKTIEDNDDDTRSYTWAMEEPMASYLAMVAVGDFVEARDDSGAVPIRNYFPADTEQSFIATFDATAEIMDWLIDLLGPYPFAEYGVIVLPGFPAALETQSISVFGNTRTDELVVVHELLHQWFGNSVTAAQWSDTWLHEGFAAYFMALWVEKRFGAGAYEGLIRSNFGRDASMPAPGTPDIEGLFGQHVYFRGALVLHALRAEVGDETFFDILRQFYAENIHGNVTSEDFIALAERVSDRDLGDFFDAWLYGDTRPELP